MIHEHAPYIVAVVCAVLGLVVEIAAQELKTTTPKKTRDIYSGVALVLQNFALGALLYTAVNVFTILLLAVQVYRVVNIVRVAEGRLHLDYQKGAVRRTTLVLLAVQVLLGALWYGHVRYSALSLNALLNVLAMAAAAGAAVMLFSTLRTLTKASKKVPEKYLADMDLPTVSVCIPARNETDDLPACLAAIVANDYPKLEILVLDDCSTDRTSEIIKGFAQDGVRFIPGDQPRKGWLAKNQAYQALVEAASGEVLLFCGVDTRFGPRTIRTLVANLQTRHKDMLSVLPVRRGGGVAATLIQPLRYWWELAFPRRLFNRPPVLSTCWMITRPKYKKLGGFAAVPGSVLPEAYFARELVRSDGYAFIRTSGELAVETRKAIGLQRDTAIRMRYPQLRRRPEWVMLLSATVVVGFILPYLLIVLGVFFGRELGLVLALSVLTVVLLTINNVLILKFTVPRAAWIGLISLPLAVLIELTLANESMWRYEFDKVIWKERNICIPVLQATARLPKA